MVQDKNLRGLPVGYCFVDHEKADNLRFMYDQFTKYNNPDSVEVIMVDKDLSNIELIKKYFPKATILLCTFHVFK